MSSNRPRFLVIDKDIHPAGISALQEVGEVTVVPSTISEDELFPKLKGVVGILVRKGLITERLVAAAPDLKIVARHGVGVDSVDLKALARRNILLTITGSANSNAVAEYAFTMMLALARQTAIAAADMKAGQWLPTRYMGVELAGKVLGIVGFGQIGRIVGRQAKGFGMQVLVFDPLITAGAVSEEGAAKVDYDELLSRADFLTYHVRLTDETRGMFGARELDLVKPGVRIINTARGGICSEDVLLRGLETGKIGGVALDTFEKEPVSSDNPLLNHPHALLSPHIAGQTEEAMKNMSLSAANALIDFVSGRTPSYIYQQVQ